MTTKLKRWIRNWLGVTDGFFPHRFVVLINYRNQLLGVDGNGDFYTISTEYEGIPVFQLLTRNPLEGNWR